MEKYKEINVFIAVAVILLIGAVAALAGVIVFPIIMCKETGSLMWLIGYAGYVAIAVVLCKKFLD